MDDSKIRWTIRKQDGRFSNNMNDSTTNWMIINQDGRLLIKLDDSKTIFWNKIRDLMLRLAVKVDLSLLRNRPRNQYYPLPRPPPQQQPS